MTTPALSTTTNSNGLSPALKTILIAGFITGILDATAAMVHSYFWNDVTPDRIWKYVAGGALGTDAFSGGGGTVAVGLLCHFTIAFIWTITFFYLYPTIRKLHIPIVITGMLWGLVVWTIMTWIVVPMSALPPRKGFDFVKAIPQILIHLFIVGLPMSLIIHRYYTRRHKYSNVNAD